MNPIDRPHRKIARFAGLLLGLLHLCCAGITAADVPATTFTHLGTREGLPGQTVYAVEQDAQGFMWFATSSGLARFDGWKMTVYRHAPGSTNTIADNTVRSLLRDRQDRLWAVTDAGLCHYRESTDDFSCVADPRGELRGAGSVAQTEDGTIWLGGDGLIRVDPASGAVRRFDWGSASSERTDNTVLAVHVDGRNRIWVGTLHSGLYLFDPQTASFTHVELGPREAAEQRRQFAVRAVAEDGAGRMWVGTDGGLSRLSATAELEAFYSGNLTEHADSWGLSDARISALGLDADGSLWIGTQAGDLDRYVEASDTFRHYRPDPEQQAAAEETPIYAVFRDATGLMWFAARGLDRLDVASEHLLRHEPEKEDAGDATARSPERLTAPGTSNALLLDHTNVLWAAVPSRGLVRYGRVGGPDQMLYQHDPSDPNSLSSNSVRFLHEDAAGRLWIGTSNGLDRFERDSGRFTHIGAGPEGEAPREYRAIGEDSDGRLWLGTERGLIRFDPANGRFDHYTTANGLPHDLVNAVAIDRSGIVWVGTESGLARVDPVTESIRTLFREQGLPDEQVLRLSMGRQGELLITTHKGLVSLRPEEFERAPEPAPVGVTAIELFNAPLPADRRDAEGLRLGHADNVLTLRLRVFDYRDPLRNRLMYKLDGFDPDWIVADPGQRRATYTNLPPGTYRFRYRGMGASGNWHDGQQPIALTVLPAPWLTPWAFLGYATALVVAVLLFVRLRLRRTLEWTRALETTVHQRTHELQEQSERLRQAVEAKDRLYANVSHEFRTPLTVILGPVERLLWEEQAPKRRQHLEIVRRNAQRLLRLVEQILSLARIDAVRTADSPAVRIDTLVNTLVQSFMPLADDKGTTLAIRADAPCWVACDRDALEKIAINLISNAIKYTPQPGRIDVFVERGDGERVELVVQDTGIGIPEDEQERVFQRFYRVGDRQEAASGSGLGLALVKELAEANDARVGLRSCPGQGTTMRIAFRAAEPPAGYAEDTEHQDTGPKLADLEAANLRVDDVETVQRGKTSLPVILVIEDNADLCWHIEQVLGEGFQCQFARDGEAGVEQALESMPDLVICDVMLPKLNGFEVTRRIKEDERTSHVPVIMLTARSDEDSRIAGLKALADEYVTKPFSEAELRQRVDTLLSIREILRQRFAREARRLAIEELPAEIGLRDRRFLERVQLALATRHADPDFSTAEFASLVAMSERQMQRKLKALVNQAPRDYLRSYRLERAVELLCAGEPAGSVAFAVGFASQAYFTSCFRAEYGTTPGQFSAAKSESSRAS